MLTFGSLFSGALGMDIGMERAGLECRWACEKNEACRQLIESKRPGLKLYRDVRGMVTDDVETTDVICGGDPCPKHSRARSNGDSKSPDLAGYFLAVVGRLRPGWVVRENVPAPTVDDFATALDAIGYGVVVIRIDAAALTGQSRQRDFVIGRAGADEQQLRRSVFQDCRYGAGAYSTRLGAGQITPALTTHRTRYDSRDCYVWEQPRGLRILESVERERLAGFPDGWTAGFSPGTRARMCGNSCVPGICEWIGKRIVEASGH